MPGTELRVSMLDAFERDSTVAGTPFLIYPNLARIAGEAAAITPVLFDEFWEADIGSLREEDIARRTAMGYYVLTGSQLHNVRESHQPQVAERFTQASIEIYGEPEEVEFQRVLNNRIMEFSSYAQAPGIDTARLERVQGTLEEYYDGQETAGLGFEELLEPAIRITKVLEEEYSEALNVFDELDPERELSQDELIALFDRIRLVLAEKEPIWNTWSIGRSDKDAMAADVWDRIISVGISPRNPKSAKKSFIHEFLGHALKAINGSKTGEHLIEHGLPFSLDADEGFNGLIEYGQSGVIPIVRIDKYLDFGMALGTGGKRPMTRRELHRLYCDRSILRAQAESRPYNEDAISKRGWGSVNRVYRGSLEDDVISVNTKDLTYYKGLKKIGNYVKDRLENGADPTEILHYLLSGIFDPTNPRHVQFVSRFN